MTYRCCPGAEGPWSVMLTTRGNTAAFYTLRFYNDNILFFLVTSEIATRRLILGNRCWHLAILLFSLEKSLYIAVNKWIHDIRTRLVMLSPRVPCMLPSPRPGRIFPPTLKPCERGEQTWREHAPIVQVPCTHCFPSVHHVLDTASRGNTQDAFCPVL